MQEMPKPVIIREFFKNGTLEVSKIVEIFENGTELWKDANNNLIKVEQRSKSEVKDEIQKTLFQLVEVNKVFKSLKENELDF